jgi:hypothetical protein
MNKRIFYQSNLEQKPTRFTWTFIKIVPLLAIVPVFSFYMFSFQKNNELYKILQEFFNGSAQVPEVNI